MKLKKSTTGLVFGILSLIFWILPILGLPIAIIGIVLGINGIKQNKEFAIPALICSIVGLSFTMINGSFGVCLSLNSLTPLIN